jgi:hypothetical protein
MMRTTCRLAIYPVALLLFCLPTPSPAAADAARPPAPTLKPSSSAAAPVDRDGFIRRWLVLEPASVNGRLTQDEVEKLLQTMARPDATRAIPHSGDSVDSGGAQRRWHALDTTLYNLNLYHFAWALSKPTSNVLFEVVTVVDAPRDMQDVRLAIGSNAASVWWLNDERVIALYNDRQAVVDDGVSKRVTLRKGRNVIRAVIINAGGATDFCARFLDARDEPITNLRVSLADR